MLPRGVLRTSCVPAPLSGMFSGCVSFMCIHSSGEGRWEKNGIWLRSDVGLGVGCVLRWEGGRGGGNGQRDG